MARKPPNRRTDATPQQEQSLGFSGDSRNMKSGGRVPCRVMNDFYPQYAPKRLDSFHMVPVLHGLPYYDMQSPDSVGTYDRFPSKQYAADQLTAVEVIGG